MRALSYSLNSRISCSAILLCFFGISSWAQLTDRTQAPNTANVGIAKSLEDEMGPGRGDANSWNSSIYMIQRDPFRSIRRGRQLFQRKFTRMQGQGASAFVIFEGWAFVLPRSRAFRNSHPGSARLNSG